MGDLVTACTLQPKSGPFFSPKMRLLTCQLHVIHVQSCTIESCLHVFLTVACLRAKQTCCANISVTIAVGADMSCCEILKPHLPAGPSRTDTPQQTREKETPCACECTKNAGKPSGVTETGEATEASKQLAYYILRDAFKCAPDRHSVKAPGVAA